MKTNRHPTEKKSNKSTDAHSNISIGNRERQLLRYVFDLEGKRLNIKAYSRHSNSPRSSVYDMLTRLINKGLIERKNIGNHIITIKGKTVIETTTGVSDNSRQECRNNINLSTHFTRYTIPITDRSKFSTDKIKRLNPMDWRTLELPNLKQHYIYFEDATIIINPKKIAIRIHDIITEDTVESSFESFGKALTYIQQLKNIGIVGERILLDQVHYARVESLLADSLSKIDERYFLELKDGTKFWIDNSTGKSEDETNRIDAREKIDNFLKDVLTTNSLLSDIDKQTETIGMLIKLKILDTNLNHNPEMDNSINNKERPKYFG